jgi:hypothetical protein
MNGILKGQRGRGWRDLNGVHFRTVFDGDYVDLSACRWVQTYL